MPRNTSMTNMCVRQYLDTGASEGSEVKVDVSADRGRRYRMAAELVDAETDVWGKARTNICRPPQPHTQTHTHPHSHTQTYTEIHSFRASTPWTPFITCQGPHTLNSRPAAAWRR